MIISGGWRLDLPPQQLCRIYYKNKISMMKNQKEEGGSMVNSELLFSFVLPLVHERHYIVLVSCLVHSTNAKIKPQTAQLS
mmetsp:Transcript_40751/g.66353  ORF Transcript_40751/g.66353 Transcript_40751/m.66353 type:complete len:81 (+) Transcript_40751:270-512(+)